MLPVERQPAVPIQPGERLRLVAPKQPAEWLRPAAPKQPAEWLRPVVPMQPGECSRQVVPEQPAARLQPVEPLQLVASKQPAEPLQPVDQAPRSQAGRLLAYTDSSRSSETRSSIRTVKSPRCTECPCTPGIHRERSFTMHLRLATLLRTRSAPFFEFPFCPTSSLRKRLWSRR